MGCGWKEAYHPWSKGTHIYTTTELLDHFLHIVLLLDKTEKYPDQAPFEMPHIPVFQSLGTQTNDVQNWHDNQQKVKEDAMLKALKE